MHSVNQTISGVFVLRACTIWAVFRKISQLYRLHTLPFSSQLAKTCSWLSHQKIIVMYVGKMKSYCSSFAIEVLHNEHKDNGELGRKSLRVSAWRQAKSLDSIKTIILDFL